MTIPNKTFWKDIFKEYSSVLDTPLPDKIRDKVTSEGILDWNALIERWKEVFDFHLVCYGYMLSLLLTRGRVKYSDATALNLFKLSNLLAKREYYATF